MRIFPYQKMCHAFEYLKFRICLHPCLLAGSPRLLHYIHGYFATLIFMLQTPAVDQQNSTKPVCVQRCLPVVCVSSSTFTVQRKCKNLAPVV